MMDKQKLHQAKNNSHEILAGTQKMLEIIPHGVK